MLIDITLKITPKIAADAQGNEKKALVGHLGTHFDVMNKEFPLEYTKRKGILFNVSHIENTTLSKMSLKEWSLTKIRTLELTKRQYYNMSMIIRQCLDYAAEQGLIPSNFVVLVPKAIGILQKMEKTGEYIFTRNGERLTSRQIAYVLEKYAERQGVVTKSTHKMRKTFASNLNASGVPLDCIRELLGHSNLNTTLGYIYNPLTEKETYDLISKAL